MLKSWLLSLSAGISALAFTYSASAGTTVEVFGGPSFLRKDTASFIVNTTEGGVPIAWDTNVTLTPHSGFAAGAIVGYQFQNGLGLGLEGTFRRAGIDVSGAATAVIPVPVPQMVTSPISSKADEKAFALMMDISYEVPVGGPVSVYVEQGYGVAWNNSTHFAWQIGAGFNIALGKKTALSIGFRHFDGGGVDLGHGGEAKVVSGDVKVGLKFRI